MEEENILIKKSVDEFLSKNSKRYEVLSIVYNLTEDNYQETINIINDNIEILFKDHPSAIYFFYYVIMASKFNFKKSELYADLIVNFSSQFKSANTTENELISICFMFTGMLNFLFLKNFFTIESIIEKSFTSDEIFITFLPEIEKYDHEYVSLREKRIFNKNRSDLKKLFKYYKFVKSNPEKHIFYRQLNYHPSPVHKSIRDDDVETLQSLLSNNNYGVNYHIEHSYYERLKMVLNDDMSLLQVAAFYGSLKVFKFLMMQKDIIYDDNLISYAYAGKNFEIIHLCEQNCSLFNAQLQSIYIHRQDLLDYYIDNFSDQIVEDNEKISDALKYFIEEEDNMYEFLNYSSLCSSIFSSNFDVIKPCLRKIAFISRNIVNVEGKNFESDLLFYSCFDLELFKFLYNQRKPNVNKFNCRIYFKCLDYCLFNKANDTFKFLFIELKDHIHDIQNILYDSIMHNHDIANFILDYQLNEDRENENSLFKKIKDNINEFALFKSIEYYNEDIIVKMIQLYGLVDGEFPLNNFVNYMRYFLSSKMILSLISRILPFIKKELLNVMIEFFQSMSMESISDYILSREDLLDKK